jgi:hypothetical protein
MALRDLINSAAKSSGIDPDLLARIVRIESGNDPYARTGSYHGLLQLSRPEFQRFNPAGDIYDPAANLNAGAAKLAQEVATFRQNYGRDPTPTDIYMTHQQGQGGYAAHTANPEGAAWRNMASTGEGQQKGDYWARKAIWGNIPDPTPGGPIVGTKAQFPGGVDTVTSKDFFNLWRNKVEGTNPQPPSPSVQYAQGDTPALGTPAAPTAPSAASAPAGAPAAALGGLGGLLARLVGAQPTLAPVAGLLGIPGQPPQGAPASPMGALSAPYQPELPPPLQMPDFQQLQFAGQQPQRLARPPVKFGRGFY